MAFLLDGKALHDEYDEVEDILYLWIDDRRASVTYETEAGHLAQLDPDSHEFIGVTIVDFRAEWEGKPISIQIPQFEQRLLEPA